MPTLSAAMSMRTLLAFWVALVACAAWCFPARAAVEAQHPGATIRIPFDSLPREVQSGNVTILAWVWHDPSAPGWTDGSGSILTVPGAFELRIDTAGRVHAALLRTYLGIGGPGATHGQAYEWPADQPAPPGPQPIAIAGMTPRGPADVERLGVRSAQPIAPRQWTLVAVVLNRGAGSIALHTRSTGAPGAPPVTAADPSWRNAIFQPDATLVLGAIAGTRPAMPGALGLIAIRRGLLITADVDAIAAAPSLLAGLFLDNRPQGGTLNGPAGAMWATNHALAALPVVMTTPGPQASAAAIVGAPVTRYNVITTEEADDPYFFATVRRVDHAEGFVHRSHHDAPYAGRFGRTLPGSGVGPGVIPGPDTIARELIEGPTTLRRVIISANSRAVKFGDGSGTSPGNFPHGFIELYRSQTAGVLMRPALIGTPGNPWFGFDCKLEEPNQDYPRVFNTAATTDENHADFARFFTGSAYIGRGPGWGLFMRPTAFYALKCKPEPGSLMTAEHPLTVEAYLLRFPGASPVAWRAERGMSQRHVGIAGDWSAPITMDTTRYARTLQPGDAATTTTITLAGDLRGLIQSGDAVFVTTGSAAESISVVQSVGFNPGAGVTAITLQRPFNRAPAIGAELRFGPWSFLTVEHTFAGVAQGDPNTWRGLRFRAENAGGGAVVYAFSAFRPGVSGFAWGGAGWGGHGYTMQLNAAIPASNPAWMALTKADIWLQVPAQQGSPPSSMNNYLAHIRAALPNADVVWAGESGLAASNQADWHAHILNNAAAAGVVGLSSLEHPDLGNVFEQYADGMLGDADHFSQRGNLTMARVWMSLLATALRPRCLADVNNDGSTDLADYFAFLDAYDNARPEADLNRDGSTDLADFFAFLHAFDTGC